MTLMDDADAAVRAHPEIRRLDRHMTNLMGRLSLRRMQRYSGCVLMRDFHDACRLYEDIAERVRHDAWVGGYFREYLRRSRFRPYMGRPIDAEIRKYDLSADDGKTIHIPLLTRTEDNRTVRWLH